MKIEFPRTLYIVKSKMEILVTILQIEHWIMYILTFGRERATKVSSLRGVAYIINFIDDFSIKVWIYLLKHKN